MRIKRFGLAVALGLTGALALAGCGGASSAGSGGADTAQQSVASASGAGKTITVWVMNGDYTADTINAINAEFTKQTGAQVNVQNQDWNGITTKITTALATSTPPDVLDLGNTQVASFAANGGLADLTAYKEDFAQGQTWLGGLVDPATYDGALYAIPGFAGARAVIYDKTMWANAGVSTPPTTYDELTADLEKVKAANPAPDFSAFYLPGQNFYAGMQFVWDAGGDIATVADGKWTSGLSTAQAQQGLQDWKEFQNEFSTPASQTLDTDSPDSKQVFAGGKAGAILGTNGYIANIMTDNPAMTQDTLGSFALPGKSGKNQPVMLGGSDWGIAAKSQNSDLALQWVKIATSPEIQKTWVFGNDHWIPNSIEATKAAAQTVPAVQKGFFDAALNSKATPASPNWAQIEGSKLINHLFSDVASGAKTPEQAATEYDTAADQILNATS